MNVELRAPTVDDLQELADLINRDSQELFGEREETVESMREWLSTPGLNPETDMRIAVADGAFRGYVDIDDDPHPVYWVDLRVPVSEPDDVREALADWVVARAAERGAAQARFHVISTDEATKRVLAARGMHVIRHFFQMRIELDPAPERPQWPDGSAVRTMTPEDIEAVYEAHQESFEDHWEHTRKPFDEWKHAFLGEGFDPGLWFLAEADGELAGVSLCRQHQGEPDQGVVRVLGVRAPWRRRRLGRALLLHSFHVFRERGLNAAVLGVDAASLTGANRLYESIGMRVDRQSAVYELTL